MSVDAPKPLNMQAIDYADHTVEIDTRCFAAHKPTPKARVEVANDSSNEALDDLTATQVNELLTAWPKKS